jgi:HlyD family secretion protein
MRGRAALLAAACIVSACASAPPGFSGTVQTEYVSVGSQVGGRVIETDVSAGTRVRRGDVIVRLDPAMLRAQYDQAVAQERAAQASLQALESGTLQSQIELARGSNLASQASYAQTLRGAPERLAAARAALANARANAILAQRTYERTAALASTGDVSRQSLDQARAQRDQAFASVRASRAQLAQLIRADLPGEAAAAQANAAAAQANYNALAGGTKPAAIAQARAQVADARASAAHALAELREATIYTPADGVVSTFNLHPGDMLAANQTAAVIDTFADPYVYIYASQSDLARIRNASRMSVRSDAGAGTFQGRVAAYDRTAQFTPQNVETADQRAELVYGVKIRISDPKHALLDGTTVTVEPQ